MHNFQDQWKAGWRMAGTSSPGDFIVFLAVFIKTCDQIER